MGRRQALVAAGLALVLGLSVTASAAAAPASHPRNPAPAWFTSHFKKRVNAAGRRGVPVDGPSVLDVCPGAVVDENGVGPGCWPVDPFGCMGNFGLFIGHGDTWLPI